MSSNSWIVDPLQPWVDSHREQLPEANLPDTPRCDASLMGYHCGFILDHPGSHVLFTASRPFPPGSKVTD